MTGPAHPGCSGAGVKECSLFANRPGNAWPRGELSPRAIRVRTVARRTVSGGGGALALISFALLPWFGVFGVTWTGLQLMTGARGALGPTLAVVPISALLGVLAALRPSTETRRAASIAGGVGILALLYLPVGVGPFRIEGGGIDADPVHNALFFLVFTKYGYALALLGLTVQTAGVLVFAGRHRAGVLRNGIGAVSDRLLALPFSACTATIARSAIPRGAARLAIAVDHEDAFTCDLPVGHEGPHYSMVGPGSETSDYWVRWSPQLESELELKEMCSVDSADDTPCTGYGGHPGPHFDATHQWS